MVGGECTCCQSPSRSDTLIKVCNTKKILNINNDNNNNNNNLDLYSAVYSTEGL